MTTKNKKKERILIVDDTPANIDVLGAILMEEYDVSVAVNGPMALEIISSGILPDLVLLDIMMPEMDGYEVARRLKADAKTSSVPVIFVTAKIEEEDEARGFKIGAVDYIRKPVNSDVTLARIRSQLELKRLRDNLAFSLEESTSQVEASAMALAGAQASAQKHLIYFRELFMNSPYGIILVGLNNKIINSNQSFSNLIGYDKQKILGCDASSFSVARDLQDDHHSFIQNALTRGSVSMETRCFHKSGYEIQVSALAYPVTINNSVQGVFVFYENISQRKQFENKLKHQAFHDALTGIPNRVLFADQLSWALEAQQTDKRFRFAVMLIDLDRFKRVNDTLGHQAGDELLRAVTEKIQTLLRAGDTLARLGGDEFAVLLTHVKSRDEVESVASRILKAAESKFVIQGQDVHISASIGIVLETGSYASSDQLIRDADLAMYQAKDAGRAAFRFFTPDMRKELLNRVSIEKELRNAMENRELALYFQSIVSIRSGEVRGFEALIRWEHPERGVISPDQFIPIAEETGLIIPMGEWVIREACRSLVSFQADLGRDLTMNINISVKQFLQDNFIDILTRAVKAYNLSPACIKLEFTESLLMSYTDAAVEKLEALRSLGFALVIDDFGTGYSSLSYLQQFPIDQIKIDRSFISSLDSRPESEAIVTSILTLSHSLGLSSVAEGVETPEQLSKLEALNCRYGQGYSFSNPMPMKQVCLPKEVSDPG